MSRHHVASKHSTDTRKRRAEISTTLPAPCIAAPCLLGGVVRPGDKWDVAHRVAAVEGGRTTKQNTGPAHTKCNRSEGGRVGRAIQTRARRAGQEIREW